MSSTPRHAVDDGRPPSDTRLLWIAGILLLLPMVAIAAIPIYAKDGPKLGAFPFFVWYQLLWVGLTACCTLSAHALVKRARRVGAERAAAGDRA